MGTMSERLRTGKVPWELVGEVVRDHLPDDVLLGPGCGEDAAVLRLGGELWALATDPISFTATDAGRLAVVVNANDVAVRGAEPRFFVATVLLAPDEATPERARELLGQVRSTCRELDIALVGGHTEVAPGLGHSMVIGTMLGRVTSRAITTGGLQPGDHIGLTRTAGLEGTSILLAEHHDRWLELHPDVDWTASRREVEGAGLSVVDEALACARIDGVSALHDVTEGGVGQALHELAQASGLELEVGSIPVLESTRLLCADLGLDPHGLIGSGALLVGCAEAARSSVETALGSVPITWIARSGAGGPPAVRGVPRFPRDELLKAFVASGAEAVVFDLDGTLVASEYDWPAIRSRLAVSGASIIDELNGLPAAERASKWSALEAIEERATDAATLHAGVPELLDLLRQRHLPTALVTNNSEANTARLLDRFGLAFDVVLTRGSGLWKPSGAPIAEAVRQLGVAPERVLSVGDSVYDLRASAEAGCGWVVLLTGGAVGHRDDADHVFPDVRALLRYLRIVL
jgi:HAD superfamily hydrolase (TIGR01549 family)